MQKMHEMTSGQARLNVAVILLCFIAAACNTTAVKIANHKEVILERGKTPEELLDVGIGIFAPGVDIISAEKEGVHPRVREAETQFMPYKLMETLRNSGNWGVVRVIPDRLNEMDVWIDAEILKSDGENLWLQVTVEDAWGRRWFSRKYTEIANRHSYRLATAKSMEPFQKTYNQIANDMLAYRNRFDKSEVKAIRVVSELKFAKDFFPGIFNEYLELDEQGRYLVKRLPAENDPLLLGIRQVRKHCYIFVDKLQRYYASFVNRMETPYLEWREAFYLENQVLKESRVQANAMLISGVLLAALGGALVHQGADSESVETGLESMELGTWTVGSALEARRQAREKHAATSEGFSDSLASKIDPHTTKLEDRAVTLSDALKKQYAQWHRKLKKAYEMETGRPLDQGAPY